MTTIPETAPFEIEVPCSLSATEQAERSDEWATLLAEAEALTELAEGYALRFANRPEWITRAAQLIVAERACCPFFGFTLAFEPGEGPVWLHIVGPGEVKGFIREQMVPARLRARP